MSTIHVHLHKRARDRKAKDAGLTFASRTKGQELFKEGQKVLAQANNERNMSKAYPLIRKADELFAEARRLSMIEDRKAKDVDAVKCWECGERFPPGTTVYPPHQTASGSRCPMSGRPVPANAVDRKAKKR